VAGVKAGESDMADEDRLLSCPAGRHVPAGPHAGEVHKVGAGYASGERLAVARAACAATLASGATSR
jgi:hypothetical protein